MSEPLYIGIDGGASTVRVGAYTRQVTPLAQVTKPHSVNPSGIGRDLAAQRLQDALRAVIAELPADAHIKAVGAGIAGADSRYAGDWVRETVRVVLPNAEIFPSADYEVALVGATGERYGVLLLSGTGSSSFGINRDGASVVVGGWGYRIGDEGSGYELAEEAIRRLTHAIDGRRPPTPLTERLMEHIGLENPRDDLLEWTYHTAAHQDIAACARVVVEMAGDGDAEALALVETSAGHLYDHYAAIVRQLDMQDPPIGFAGGLLTADTALAHALAAKLGLDAPPTPKYPPVAGAALLAMLLTEEA